MHPVPKSWRARVNRHPELSKGFTDLVEQKWALKKLEKLSHSL
jgi:hypothetical protein